MDRIINVSDRSNAAIHALALAAAAGGRVTASLCARTLGVSPSYLAKILQLLVRSGFLVSSRGASGGVDLAREASGITCLEVIELFDGPLPHRDCLFKTTVCPRGGCALKELCSTVEGAVASALASTSIAAIAASFKQ